MAIIFLFKQDHKKYEIKLFIETKEGTKFWFKPDSWVIRKRREESWNLLKKLVRNTACNFININFFSFLLRSVLLFWLEKLFLL
jgi:hypothetical protein